MGEFQFLRKLFAAANSSGRSDRRWQVLAFDMCAKQSPPGDGEGGSQQISKFSRTEWRTLWCDSRSSRAFEGLITCLDGHVNKLATRVISKTKAHRCGEGNLCCRYTVEVLEAQPVAGGKSRLLWRSPESRFLDFCRCDSLPDNARQRVDAEESSSFSIQSIVEDNISIDTLTDEYDIASGNPHGGRSWQTLKIAGARLRKCRIPRTLIAKADAAFVERMLNDAAARDYDPGYVETDGYLLFPYRGGVAVEFQCGNKFDPYDASLYRLRLEEPEGVDEVKRKTRGALVEHYKALLPYGDIDVFTVAPDGSSIVYCRSGELLWTTVHGATTSLGAVHNFRGWQWLDSTRLPASDLEWLSGSVTAQAC